MQSTGERSILRTIVIWIACFLGTLGTLAGLFALASFIPKYMIRDNLRASAEFLLDKEEEFYQIVEGDRRTEIHNYADGITLNILYSIDGEDRFKEILLSPFYSDKVNLEKTVIELLEERITFEKQADTLYDRYWHGMILFLRPLFVSFTLQQIRWIFLGILLLCMITLGVLLWKRKLRLSVVLLWLAALLVQLPVVAFCIEYFPVFLITFLTSMVMVCWEDKRGRILGLCVVSGTSVAFFDFLTTETVAFVIPMALVYLIWEKKGTLRTLKEELLFCIKAGVLWVSSYLMTYLVKWGLSSLVYGTERFSKALSQFAGRQGNEVVSFALDSLSNNTIAPEAINNAGGDLLPQALSAVMINLRLLLGLSGKITLEHLALILVFVGLILAAVIHMFRKAENTGVLPVVLFGLGSIPLLRMMVLHNHSIEHCFFVYRSLYGTIVCYLAGIIQWINWDWLRRKKT